MKQARDHKKHRKIYKKGYINKNIIKKSYLFVSERQSKKESQADPMLSTELDTTTLRFMTWA